MFLLSVSLVTVLLLLLQLMVCFCFQSFLHGHNAWPLDLIYKIWNMAIVSQTNIGTISKVALGKLEIQGSAHTGFSERIYTILN